MPNGLRSEIGGFVSNFNHQKVLQQKFIFWPICIFFLIIHFWLLLAFSSLAKKLLKVFKSDNKAKRASSFPEPDFCQAFFRQKSQMQIRASGWVKIFNYPREIFPSNANVILSLFYIHFMRVVRICSPGKEKGKSFWFFSSFLRLGLQIMQILWRDPTRQHDCKAQLLHGGAVRRFWL